MKANVILISYNRPKMLAEAIASVLNQTHTDLDCWVYDDGSDEFDIYDVVKEFDDDRILICRGPQISKEARIKKHDGRWSTNINNILSKIPKGEFVLYLCDDDLLHYDWLRNVERGYLESPNTHIILGDLYWFYDGEDPYEVMRKGFLSKIVKDGGDEELGRLKLWWSLGDFAHRSECFFDCGLKWRMGHEGYAHSYDVKFIQEITENHVSHLIAPIPAAFRREHTNTLSYRLGRVDEDGYYYKTGGEMEISNIEGMME